MKVSVQRVVDGDSVHVVRKRGLWSLLFPSRPISVRLFGIDAPELSQPYGREAREALDRMASGTLDLEVRDTDKYGRTVGILRDSRGRNLNLQMVERGMAHAFLRYGTMRGIVQAESRAREGRRGLWRDRSVETPWAHRRAEDEALDSPHSSPAYIGTGGLGAVARSARRGMAGAYGRVGLGSPAPGDGVRLKWV